MKPDSRLLEDRYRAPALDKGLDIIELLAQQPQGLKLFALAHIHPPLDRLVTQALSLTQAWRADPLKFWRAVAQYQGRKFPRPRALASRPGKAYQSIGGGCALCDERD